jgi:hypothetical protein
MIYLLIMKGLNSLAERGRFELPEAFRLRPLSRRVHSTTLPPLRCLKLPQNLATQKRLSGSSIVTDIDCGGFCRIQSPNLFDSVQWLAI